MKAAESSKELLLRLIHFDDHDPLILRGVRSFPSLISLFPVLSSILRDRHCEDEGEEDEKVGE